LAGLVSTIFFSVLETKVDSLESESEHAGWLTYIGQDLTRRFQEKKCETKKK